MCKSIPALVRCRFPYVMILVIPLSLQARAVVLDQVLDRHLTQSAELIFVGAVEAIDYRRSEALGPEQPGMHHTFVTFLVDEIVKGSLASTENKLTLRFAGGYGEGQTFSRVGGVPLFDLGDRSLLFVRQNGTAICPLVGWERGSFRVVNDNLHSDLGHEMVLTADPFMAARIHPRDLRGFSKFVARLQQPENQAERKILDRFSEEGRLAVTNPDALPSVDPQNLNFSIPENLLSGYEREIQPGVLNRLLIPPSARVMVRDLLQVLVIRDLNALLLHHELVDVESLAGVELRPQTQQMLEADPAQMPVGHLILRNRRLLEDVFPGLLVRSLSRTAAIGRYHRIPELMTTTIGGKTLEMVFGTEGGRENTPPEPSPPPEGEVLTLGTFLEHVRELINVQKIPGENSLPPVVSVSIDEPFSFDVFEPVVAPIDLGMPEQEATTEQWQRERNWLRRSDGNPVVEE